MAKIRDIQASADHGRVLVDEQLQDLEARLTDLYARASNEAKKDLDAFLGKFADKDKDMRSKVASGEITQEEYVDWRKRTIFRTEAMTAKVNDLTQRMLHADQAAMEMVNGQLNEVYATAWNFGGYRGETFAEAAGFDYTEFTIINADAVRILATKDPDLIPWKPEVDVPKDERWNRQHLQSAIMAGIVKGDSIPNIADRLMPVVNMDRVAAIRTARTAVNGVENKGRKDATERVKEAGIPMVEAWSCTHDARTRETHILLDKTLPNEQGLYGEGIIEGNLLEYPADPNGDPSEVYNCRCAIVSTIKGMDHSKDDELYAAMMEAEYYEDWLDVKEKQEEKDAQFQAKRELALEKRAAEPYTNEPVDVDKPRKSEDVEYAGHKTDGADYLTHRKGSYGISNDGVSMLAEELDISKKEAKDIGNSVVRFVSDDYGTIREASRGENDDPDAIRDAENIEQFIELSPKWDGGEISRGIFVDGETAAELVGNAESGVPIDMLGISSWSSDPQVAWRVGGGYVAEMDDSLKTEAQREGQAIIFVNDQEFTDLGTSVEHLSYHKAEEEVLVSGDAVFIPTDVDEQPDAIYIHGYLADKEEVDKEVDKEVEQPEPVAVKSFTESEKIELMEHYISGEGYSMNKYARGEEVDDVEYTKEEIAQMTEDFEKLLKEERLPEETHVYRGTSYDSLLESTGLSLQEIIENPKAIVGETITERGFVSTTSDYSMANDYAGGRVLYSITLPEGAEAVDQNEVLGYLTEKEITVQRDSQYVITNAYVSFFDADGNPYPNGGYLQISMEYVGVRGEGQEPQPDPEPEPKKNEQEEILLANKDSELPDDKIIEITEAVEENATTPEPFETRKFDGAKDAVEYFRGSTRPSMVGAYRDHGFSVAEDTKKPATQWASKLTRDQSSAIFGYTRSGYMPVNGYLRGEIDKKDTKEMIVAGIDSTSGWSVDKYVKTLDAAIGKFDLKEPITVYRTCEREFLDKLEIGGTFHDEGFGSTSVLSVPVASGDVHLTIDVPAGKGVGAYIDGESAYEGEEFEFLLARGADYYIKDIRYTDEGVFIDAVITGFTR